MDGAEGVDRGAGERGVDDVDGWWSGIGGGEGSGGEGRAGEVVEKGRGTGGMEGGREMSGRERRREDEGVGEGVAEGLGRGGRDPAERRILWTDWHDGRSSVGVALSAAVSARGSGR